jgi:nicotinate-nucleotide adenylyltransferase
LKRIGILGGTFDPPHIGHLILAEYTMEALSLDEVLFVPVGDHPFKRNNTRTPIRYRLQMIRLAIAGNVRFDLSMVDVEREGPHYSADTVAIIQSQHSDSELYFIMGGDNLRDLPTWTRAQDLYQRARLAVMKRSDEHIRPDMHGDLLPGLSERVDIVDTPLLSIWLSSTHVIERLRAGLSVRYLVPDAVLDYIRDKKLYKHEVS